MPRSTPTSTNPHSSSARNRPKRSKTSVKHAMTRLRVVEEYRRLADYLVHQWIKELNHST
jgi:hypothetical protein